MDDVTEHWLPVFDWEGLYEVSDLGRVRSLRRKTTSGVRGGNTLKPTLNNHYVHVGLSAGGTQKNRSVHSLVAEAFYGSRPLGLVVRHLDGDYLNNVATNLVWGTQSENARDQLRHGTNYYANRKRCPQNHPYDDANTYITPQGRRQCRTCRKQRAARVAAERWRQRRANGTPMRRQKERAA